MGRAKYSFKLFREFIRFARAHRAYWILPLILILALAGLLVATGQIAAPLLYALF